MERHNSHRGGEIRRAYPPQADELPRAGESQQPLTGRERIDRGIAEALRGGRSIDHATARAIATQLHVGPDTPLYAFAKSGTVVDGLAAELDALRADDIPPELRPWLDALAGYLATRADVPDLVVGWNELPSGDSPPPDGQRNSGLSQQPHPSIRPLPAYEPALQPAASVPPSSMSRSAAFQLALDVQWARDHRPDNPDGRVAPADAEAIGRLLVAAVDVLAGRRAPAQIRHQFDPIAFAAVQTRAREAVRTAAEFRLRSIHAYQSAKGVIEACGTVDNGKRFRALVPGWKQAHVAGNARCYDCYE
jgi:hypothetical protein